MTIQHRPTIAEINLDALRHNLKQVQTKLTANQEVLSIVKANAYGHGSLMVTRALKSCGIKQLGVATFEEAIELRSAGIKGTILVLDGLLTEEVGEFLEYRLSPVIHHMTDLERLGKHFGGSDRELGIHLKMDTGMGRLGFFDSQVEAIAPFIKKHSSIRVEGIMTHLARADEEDQAATDYQFNAFKKIREHFESQGLMVANYHIANSAAIIDGRAGEFPWVRPGIMLYGAHPHPRHESMINLKPVMTLKTKILDIKHHPAGSSLGYGGTFVTMRDSRIAILPIGYADGYPRLVSNRGHVLIHGQKAPVVGRISMDLTLVDVTDVIEASRGDEVILFGEQLGQRIKVEEVASWAETISYEILCGITARVPRIYKGM